MSSERTSWDRFELRGKLGSGASGEVFRAFDPSLGWEVALKVMASHEVTPVQLERFGREGAIAARLNHPGIVRVFSIGSTGGRPFAVYELVDQCRTLGEVAQELGTTERVELMIEAAEALGYAHQQGVVHRDVKLDNLLVDGSGRLRVADFGAAIVRDLDRMTKTGALVGTPLTMAPEQLAGNREKVGAWSDVWSLGVVLYRLLTGAYPFEGATLLELSARAAAGRYVPVSSLEPDISPALERVIKRALSVDPAERYPDAGAMADALQTALEHGEGSAWAWGLSAAAVVVVALGVWWGVRPTPSTAPDLAVSPSAVATSPNVTATSSPGATPSATPTPRASPERRRKLDALMAAGKHAEVDRLLVGALTRRERFVRGVARLERGDLGRGHEDLKALATGDDAWAGAAAGLLLSKPYGGGKRDVPAGLKRIEEAVEQAPQEVPILLLCAQLRATRLRHVEALALLERVGRLSPEHWRWWLIRAVVNILQGDREAARTELDQAEQKSRPRAPAAVYLQRAAYAGQVDDSASALAALNAAVRLHPTDARLWLIRGLLRGTLGDRKGRVADMAELRRRDLELARSTVVIPRGLQLLMAYARTLRDARRVIRRRRPLGELAKLRVRSLSGAPWSELKASLDQLEARYVEDPAKLRPVQFFRLVLLRIRGRYAEGEKRAKALAGLPPPWGPQARYHQAVCLFRDEAQVSAAKELLDRLAEDGGPYGLAAASFGALLRGRLRQGFEAAQQAVQQIPTFVDARLSAAYCLGVLGNTKEFEAELAYCRRVAPDLPRLHLVEGLTTARRDPERAFKALDRWVRVVGREGARFLVLIRRARCALLTRRWAIARADFNRLLELQPGMPGALVGRGVVRSLSGDPKGALSDWRLAAQRPGYDRALRRLSASHERLVRDALR